MDDVAIITLTLNPKMSLSEPKYKQFPTFVSAKKLNPDNPRAFVLEALDKFYTPEQFGGSKEEAKKLFEQALQKYASFKPESNIHPNWGKNLVDDMLAQMK